MYILRVNQIRAHIDTTPSVSSTLLIHVPEDSYCPFPKPNNFNYLNVVNIDRLHFSGAEI